MMVKFLRMASLKTVPEVIAALGGNDHVAKTIGASYNAVSNWRARGTFPAHTYLILNEMLRRRGHRAPDSLWAMTPVRRAS
jgi:hypothetical protein